ncbi:hypothetical protein [Lachnobacterium bovis]|uniref:hypothetical protein n=1 Tax=Lachnobacterium bovis TaxID=140626 RepID=UPI00049073B9|nr:hypothetical protein [Lachnobacterium bovis]
MKISKYSILKYVCVISVELVIAACVIDSYYKVYNKGEKKLIALDKQLSLAEKDNVISKKEDNESLTEAFENRIQKDEVAKKVPGRYQCEFVSACKFEKNIYFTRYDIYNKKSNKKVGEGFIAAAKGVINDKDISQCYIYENAISKMTYEVSYITYIKVYNPDNKDENYEIKEPGIFVNFDFKKVKE